MAVTHRADPKRPYKAIIGAVVAFIGLLWANLEGHQDSLGTLSWNEWVTILVPTVVTFAAVYGIPNPVATTAPRNRVV